MKTITLDAKVDNLNDVLAFVDGVLEEADCPMKTQTQIDVAVEEIFVNVASYAYKGSSGTVTLEMDILQDPARASITFIDQGIPYNPLAKEDPDVTLSAEERQIGGLGIYIVKKSMDNLTYDRTEDKNVFTLEKNL